MFSYLKPALFVAPGIDFQRLCRRLSLPHWQVCGSATAESFREGYFGSSCARRRLPERFSTESASRFCEKRILRSGPSLRSLIPEVFTIADAFLPRHQVVERTAAVSGSSLYAYLRQSDRLHIRTRVGYQKSEPFAGSCSLAIRDTLFKASIDGALAPGNQTESPQRSGQLLSKNMLAIKPPTRNA